MCVFFKGRAAFKVHTYVCPLGLRSRVPNGRSAIQKIPRHFCNPKSSITCPQDPTIRSYREPDEFSPHLNPSS
jgi:hypothetical protein